VDERKVIWPKMLDVIITRGSLLADAAKPGIHSGFFLLFQSHSRLGGISCCYLLECNWPQGPRLAKIVMGGCSLRRQMFLGIGSKWQSGGDLREHGLGSIDCRIEMIY